MLPIRITDDRGERVELHEPGVSWRAIGRRDWERKGLSFIHEVTKPRARLSVARRVAAVVPWALFLALLVFLVARGFYAIVVILALIATGIAWDLFIGRLFQRWRHREEIARALRATGRCASCGYDTSGLTPDEAGLVTCPECGGAWRADRRRLDEGAYPRWERPRPWVTKFVRDDRGWRARMKYGLSPSLIGLRPRRKRAVFRACGRLSVASYVAGWLTFPVFIGLIIASFVYENGWLVLWGIGLGLGLALVQSILWTIAKNVHSERIRRALLEGGMCPCCDGRLPLEPESDGRRVCAECGAAFLTS